MKKMILMVCIVSTMMYAQPSIDGTFDGAAWGSAVATSDGTVGWSGAGANVGDLYVTFDATYAYFGAKINNVADWQSYGFVINTVAGGGTTEVWTYPITYGHTNAPDFVVKGHFGQGSSPYAELRYWNGSTWARKNNDNVDDALSGTDFNGNDGNAIVEVRIKRSILNNPSSVEVQFYVTGNNSSEHATFDAVPNDAVAASWNDATTLDTYGTDAPFPVELSSFNAISKGKGVELVWQTASETNNYGFEIEKKQSGSSWTTLGFKQGQGTCNCVTNYSYSDNTVNRGKVEYRLKQIDRDGKFTYSNIVEAVVGLSPNAVELSSNYPNPFNPSTSISFMLGTTGNASLIVYDVLGKEVAVIANGLFNAGEMNTFNFNASHLTSGVYYYRLTSDAKVETRKMLLMK
jgi:hypothetical protein